MPRTVARLRIRADRFTSTVRPPRVPTTTIRPFGASAATDAFFLAFKIPNFMRRLFAEGSFSLAFVPVLSEVRATGDRRALRDLIDHVSGTLFSILLVVTVLAYSAVLVTGFLGIAGTGQTSLRTLPYLVFGIIGLLHVVANASSRYRVPEMPLLMAYGSFALLHMRTVWESLRGRRLLLPAAVLIFFGMVCLPYFYDDALSLWTDGTYRVPLRP